MVAAYKDKALNIELGVIGGKVLEELEESLSTSRKGLPLAQVGLRDIFSDIERERREIQGGDVIPR